MVCWWLVVCPGHTRATPFAFATTCANPCTRGAPPLRYSCATPAPPLHHPCATPAQPLRLSLRLTLRHPRRRFGADPPLPSAAFLLLHAKSETWLRTPPCGVWGALLKPTRPCYPRLCPFHISLPGLSRRPISHGGFARGFAEWPTRRPRLWGFRFGNAESPAKRTHGRGPVPGITQRS